MGADPSCVDRGRNLKEVNSGKHNLRSTDEYLQGDRRWSRTDRVEGCHGRPTRPGHVEVGDDQELGAVALLAA